jgi:hypothetical protein
MTWSDFTKDNRKAFLGNTIEVNSATEGKKGAVKYTTPTFTLGKGISLDVSEKAEAAYDLLKEYLDSRKTSQEVSHEEVPQAETFQPIFAEPVLEMAEVNSLPF